MVVLVSVLLHSVFLHRQALCGSSSTKVRGCFGLIAPHLLVLRPLLLLSLSLLSSLILSILYHTLLELSRGSFGKNWGSSVYTKFSSDFLCILPAFKNSARLAPRRAEQRKPALYGLFISLFGINIITFFL